MSELARYVADDEDPAGNPGRFVAGVAATFGFGRIRTTRQGIAHVDTTPPQTIGPLRIDDAAASRQRGGAGGFARRTGLEFER